MARSLPVDTRSAAVARQSVEPLRRSLPPGCLEDVRLVVSELVTNAITHTGLSPDDSVELRVDVLPGLVRVEVTDRGAGFGDHGPRSGEAAPGVDEQGYGLLIVEHLAERWGVEHGLETRVWAEIPIDGSDLTT